MRLAESNSGQRRPAAFVLYIFLLGLSFLPGVSLWALWLVPAPLIVFHVTGQRRLTALLASLYTICLLYAGWNAAALVIGAGVYFLSWVMGDAMADSESPYPALVTGTFVFVMIELVLLALYRWSGGHLFTDLSTALTESIRQDQAMLGATSTANATQVAEAFMAWLQTSLPGIVSVFAILMAILNLVVARRLTGQTTSKSILLDWRLPGSLVGVYITALAIVLFGAQKDVPLWWQAANSAVLIAGFLLGIQGIAWVWRRVYHHRYAKLWLTLLIVGGLVQLIRSVYVLIGLLDMMRRAPRI